MTLSTNLSLDLVPNAGDPGTWDVPTNSNWQIFDTWVGGSRALNATGLTGDQTLLLADYQRGQLIVSGVPTGTVTYVVPSGVGGKWIFENNATGTFSTVGIKSAAGGSTVTVTTAGRTIVVCDGSATGIKLALTASAVAGGSTTQVQVNVAGALAGYAALTYDGSTLVTNGLRTTGTATFGDASADIVAFNAANLTFASNTQAGGLYIEANGGSNRVAVGQSSFGSAGAQFISSGLIQSVSGGFVFPDGTIQATAAGVGGAAGSTTQIQYNVSGSFSAQSNFTFTPGSGTLAVPVIIASGNIAGGTVSGAWQGSAVGVAYGGTALTATPANGQVPIGNGTGYTLGTLTAGSGISITNGAGTITITAASSGGSVTSVNVSGAATGLSFSGGPITTSGTISAGGILAAANGGTGVSNSGKTITLAGNLATSGAFGLTLTLTNTTSVTLPTSGTLLNTTGSGAGLTGLTAGQIGGLATIATSGSASDLSTGTVATARLPIGINSGTAAFVAYYAGTGTTVSGSTYLRWDDAATLLTIQSDGTAPGSRLRLQNNSLLSTTFAPSASSSNVILTMPTPSGVTDTLVGRSSTDTLLSKTLTTPKLTGYTVATLPTPTVTMLAYVTDGDSGLTWGATAVNSGGGATKYLVWYTGTAWTVFAK